MNEKILDIFSSDLLPMQHWASEADKQLAELIAGKSTGYTTSLTDLDKYIRFRPSEYTIIGGQSSMGKTSLGMQVVEHIADQLQQQDDDGVVAVFSAEMSGASLVMRMGAALSGVNLHKATNGKANRDELHRVRAAVERIRTKPIWIDDNSGPTTHQMLEQLSRLNERIPVRALMFDFLELAGDDAQSEEQRIGKISQNLKAIAKTLDIPSIGLSQLNDDANKRANKLPALSDLRYSRKSGHLADNVLLIMRPDYYTAKGESVEGYTPEEAKGQAVVVVAKQRNGPTGLVKCAYIQERMKFVDLEHRDLNEFENEPVRERW